MRAHQSDVSFLFANSDLDTVNNLGTAWPRFLVLEVRIYKPSTNVTLTQFELTDLLSDSECVDSSGASLAISGCISGEGQAQCAKLMGQCLVNREGYYYVSAMCLIASIFIYPLMRQMLIPLQHLPEAVWRLQERRPRSA